MTLADDANVGDLIDQITEKTLLLKFDIKYGYPPKPLLLQDSERSKSLANLDVQLNGESLTISPKDVESSANADATLDKQSLQSTAPLKATQKGAESAPSVSFAGMNSSDSRQKATKPVSLTKKALAEEVPELPLPERGATLVLRVMPDDNSCLFRAFSTAVLPTGDDLGMPEIRALVASYIQQDPETYTKVVLEQPPDDYCRWIQTEDAWGGFIEMGILAKHFEVQICSIDVQSLRIDRFNEQASTLCILVYSGIHYDTIVQSPSEPPHTKADSPPELDKRIWDSDDDYILNKALVLCRKLKERHYFTDTGGMAIKCNECGVVIYGEKQASGHAQQTGHYDMAEVQT